MPTPTVKQVMNATDLPHHSQPGRFLSRCDPFVTLSFGPKTFRTRVMRDTKNPTYNERVNLYVKQSDYEADWTLKFSVFDYESLSHNENMGSVMMPIQEMVERCIQVEHQPNEPLAFVPVTVEMALKGQTPDEVSFSCLQF